MSMPEILAPPDLPLSACFTEENSADIVNGRMSPDADERLRSVVGTLVRHLHAAVKEIRPTHAEWLAAIGFLTETGQSCTSWRQEFILLSDILGVSMLVDSLNHHRASGATENTILGPFYVEGAPEYENGANICLDGKGETLIVRGHVRDADGAPIARARLDVWQTNEEGFYDVQQRGEQPEWNLRGVFHTEADGSYWFRTVKPRFYPIPDDGPVGRLLGALGRHPNRAAHLHVIASAPGFDTAITHVFSPDCPYLAEDAVFGVKRSLIGTFVALDPAEVRRLGASGRAWRCDWDFTLSPIAGDAR